MQNGSGTEAFPSSLPDLPGGGGDVDYGPSTGIIPPPSPMPSNWQLPTASAAPGLPLGGGAPPPAFTPQGGLATTLLIGDLGWEKTPPAPTRS